MAAAAYDSFGTDRKLQEDNAILVAVAWSLLDEEGCIRAGVDPDGVADGTNSEDTSLGGQFECMAADHLPWKDALLSGHQNLESYLLRMRARVLLAIHSLTTKAIVQSIECNALFVGVCSSMQCCVVVMALEASAACFSRKISPKNDTASRNGKAKEAKVAGRFGCPRVLWICLSEAKAKKALEERACAKFRRRVPSEGFRPKDCSADVKTCSKTCRSSSEHPSPTIH